MAAKTTRDAAKILTMSSRTADASGLRTLLANTKSWPTREGNRTNGVYRYDQRSRSQLKVGLGYVEGELCSALPFAATLVLGPHRSRKTTSVIIPPLLEWSGPALVASIREDVVEQTLEARRRYGEVLIFDPGDVLEEWPDRAGWSPLDFIATWDDALSVSRILIESGERWGSINENFWNESAILMLAPYLYAAAATGGSMTDVVTWVHRRDETEVKSRIESTDDQSAIDATLSRWNTNDREKGTIYRLSK